jgi:hypothetical protein
MTDPDVLAGPQDQLDQVRAQVGAATALRELGTAVRELDGVVRDSC